jgi:hypothetical protein
MKKYFIFKKFGQNTNIYNLYYKDSDGYKFITSTFAEDFSPSDLLINYLMANEDITFNNLNKNIIHNVTGKIVCVLDDVSADFTDYTIIVFDKNEILSDENLLKSLKRDNVFDFDNL